ncbi:hypothetical protein KPL74_08540 [Bacillus sp. NP157]|nr:hypothetical protein KPL74_08540 [Bacillus sp. NP157]
MRQRYLLPPADLMTLRQLDDTSFLATRSLDRGCCLHLYALALVSEDPDGWWRITALGRHALQYAADDGATPAKDAFAP